MPDRRIVTVTGSQAIDFLQGLVTNDLRPLATADGIRWCALLTPQGKYLADFFVLRTGGALFLDLPAALAEATLARLSMYRLRADVAFAPADLGVTRGTGPAPPGALPDPRHPGLGWRRYAPGAGGDDGTGWDALRVEHLIPETGAELVPGESFILEMDFERLNGVDFRKGCYVGQEVTARMKHKTDLRKGLARVRVAGEAAPGTPILTADGREAGTLHTRSGDRALAFLRFDRIGPGLTAGTARIEPDTA